MSQIQVLRAGDVPAAMSLKEAAGWNQTRKDWELLLDLAPDGCFGIEAEGAIAATATAVIYGADLAWIGMVLTHPEWRGRGLARRLMEHAVEYLHRQGVGWIKLDATAMGRPLYRKLGFEDECAIERWMRPANSEPIGGCILPNKPNSDSLDRAAFGTDRAQLLDALSRIEHAALPGGSYAVGRPGTSAVYFGPCVSRTPEDARRLLEWFLARHPGENVFWDLLPCNTEATRLARRYHFAPVRHLVRMAMPGCPAEPLRADYGLTYAIAGFEYG